MNTEMDSILVSVKKLLGIDADYDAFDPDIILYINQIFLALFQMGIGPKKIFSIEDASSTWDEFENGEDDLKACRAYVAQRVRLKFDPPSSTTVMQSLKDSIDEMEWRLVHQVEVERNL